MKIILSRKGFDETAGGQARPIYDDKFVSFPIPYEGTKMFYKDLYFDNNISFIK